MKLPDILRGIAYPIIVAIAFTAASCNTTPAKAQPTSPRVDIIRVETVDNLGVVYFIKVGTSDCIFAFSDRAVKVDMSNC